MSACFHPSCVTCAHETKTCPVASLTHQTSKVWTLHAQYLSSPSDSFTYQLWTRCKYQEVCSTAWGRTGEQTLCIIWEYQKPGGKPWFGWKTSPPVCCICHERGSLIFVTNKRNCFQPGVLYSKCRPAQLSAWLSVAAQRINKLSVYSEL